MPGKNAGRSGFGYRKLKAHIRATETYCYRCGQRLDWSIPYRDPETGAVNDNYASLEHKQTLAKNPHLAEDPGNAAASHLICNLTAGDRDPEPSMGVTNVEW